MARGKDFGGGIHILVFREEAAHIACKLPVFGHPGGVQRSGSLFIRAAYLSPAECAGCDKWGQLILAPRDGYGLFVGATVCVCYLATSFGSQPRSQLDQCHA